MSDITPERYSMRLRSVCRQFGCNLGQYSEDESSPTSTPRKFVQKFSSKLHHHHKHFHSSELVHGRSSNGVSHSLKNYQPVIKNQISPSKDFSPQHFYSLRISDNVNAEKFSFLNSSSENDSKRSYSDYFSDNEESESELREKTDYTYAKSVSYNSRATPNRPWESPNMSRTRLTASLNSSVQSSSSSEDDFILFGKGLHSSHLQTNRNSSDHFHTGSFHKLKLANNIKNTEYSTVIKHAYGLDSEYSESEEENMKKRQVLTSASSDHNFLSSESRIVSSLNSFPVIRLLSVINNWLWYSLWSSIYKIMCNFLLLDTWLLSRFSGISKRRIFFFILLPLFFPFLFLLCTTLYNTGYSSVATSLLLAVKSFLTSALAYTSSMFALWKNTNASIIGSGYVWNIWNNIFGISKAYIPSGSDSSVSQSFMHEQDIHTFVRNIFQEEFSGWMLQVTKEQKEFVQKQVEELTRQSMDMKILQEKHLEYLSKDLADLKLSIQTTSSQASKVEGERLDETFLHSKLEHLEAQLRGMQDILLSLRNCCRNQTDYIKAAERHLVALLLQTMNGTGKADNPFAAFGDWINSQFVKHEEMKVHLNAMTDHISSDVLHQTETIANRVVAAALSRSLKELKSNTTSHFSHKSSMICTSEDDVKNIVREAIYLYDADKTGLVDYALESSGGSVISTRCAETYHTGTAQFRLFGIPFWYTSNSPRTVIQPGVHPGQCWAFKGTHGYLVIELSTTIKPSAFSLEHIPKSLSPTGSIDSAPKEFSVMGLKKETDLEGILLGRYIYNADGEPLQYFAVEDQNVDFYPIVELRIHSNYGNTDYTCLYRFRVHGSRQ